MCKNMRFFTTHRCCLHLVFESLPPGNLSYDAGPRQARALREATLHERRPNAAVNWTLPQQRLLSHGGHLVTLCARLPIHTQAN